MNIVNRILWVFLALFCALYAVAVVGCYAVIAPIVWLVWWLVTKKNFKIENILTNLLMPLIIVFDYLENYDEDEELKNVEDKLQ
jgi:hypothetical protein